MSKPFKTICNTIKTIMSAVYLKNLTEQKTVFILHDSAISRRGWRHTFPFLPVCHSKNLE